MSSEREDEVLRFIRDKGIVEVRELIRILGHRSSDDELLSVISKLEDEGKIRLDLQVPVDKTFREFLRDSEHSLWLYLIFLLSLLTLFSIYVLPSFYPLVIVRWVFGSFFVLFLPGFALVEALFPRRSDLSGIERLALSIGLSIAVTPLIGLMLNYTPWGIRLTPIVISMSAFTFVISLLAAYRKFKAGQRVYLELVEARW